MNEDVSKITELINLAIGDRAIYGASFSLVDPKQCETQYIGTQGEQNDAIPLKPGMLYDLASLTKVVGTTTRILQLLTEHRLKLTDQIGQFVSGLREPQLTIEQLLLHTSGLPADLPAVIGLDRTQLVNAVKKTALASATGSQTIYSDLNFILLGWVIKEIDGDLAESFQKYIFLPLKMQNTGFNLHRNDLAQFVPTEYKPERGTIVRGEVHDEKAFILGGVSGHAGLFSTLDDLSHFVQMLEQNGLYEGKQVLSPTAMELLRKYHHSGRTLGWDLWPISTPQELKIWHTGFTGTSIAIDLVHKTGFICLTNHIYPTRKNTKWFAWRKKAVESFFEHK